MMAARCWAWRRAAVSDADADAGAQAAAAPQKGAPARGGATPLMEHVRVTSPELDQRAALDRARKRILVAACLFVGLYFVLGLKLHLVDRG